MATIVELITAEAQRQGLDPSIAIEVARAESNLDPNTPDSSAGAIGLFQLEPATAADLGINPRDVSDNIRGGVMYLRQLLGKFGAVPVALAAYDWGMGNVQRAIASWGSGFLAHAPAETKNYVAKILRNLAQYTATVTPASIANGVTQIFSAAAPPPPAPGEPAALPPPTDNRLAGIAILTGLAIGVYIIAEVFSND
jgi:Transglycosylase SLT domain